VPRIKVEFMGTFKSLAGDREVKLNLRFPARLIDVIEKSIEPIGGRLREYLTDPDTGKIKTNAPQCMIKRARKNYYEVVTESYDHLKLNEGDVVLLLHPLGSG
jgi:hypothetical protein